MGSCHLWARRTVCCGIAEGCGGCLSIPSGDLGRLWLLDPRKLVRGGDMVGASWLRIKRSGCNNRGRSQKYVSLEFTRSDLGLKTKRTYPGVADLMSPGEIESKTPGKSKIVLSPRSLLSALPGERLGERPRRRRSGANSNLLETFRAPNQKGATRW